MTTTTLRTPTWSRIRFGILIFYTVTMMLLLGGLLVETFMVYPNIFHNAPERFPIALQFMSITGPAQYFRPFGMASVLLGVLTTVSCWPVRTVRWWVLASLVMIGLEGLASMLYFWPLNRFLFIEGAAVHPAEMLRQTAADFQTWHSARVILNAASAAFAFTGLILLTPRTAAGQRRASSRPQRHRPPRAAGT